MILTDRKTGGRYAQPVAVTSGGGDVGVREVAATYHVPISNTVAGMMLLEPRGRKNTSRYATLCLFRPHFKAEV
jgi:hypothetical protein